MAARWDIAAVLVALMAMLVSASPTTISLLETTSRRLAYLIWPARGRCRRFLWGDVHDGLLHLCDPRGCSHDRDGASKLHNARTCWDQTLGQIFNRTWYFINADENAPKNMTKKPDQLPLHDEYIQTDIQTLKAFLLLTTGVCRSCETVDVVTLLHIQLCRGLITIHLPSSGSMPINKQLTKFEVDRILEGYPPFFREHFVTTGGHTLPFPITETNHIQRGAWVLSVGMTISTGQTPEIHNMQRISHKLPDVYWKGTHVLTAFQMINRTLSQLKVHENSRGHPRSKPSKGAWTEDALRCFHMIMEPEYSSQPWALKKEQIEGSDLFKSVMGDCPCYRTCIDESDHAITCRRNQHNRKDPAKALTKEQCVAALEIFNGYQHAERNLQIIWPVLPEILQSVILGVSEVEQYFSYRGQKLDLPKDVAEQRYVYLRRCSKEDE